MLISLCIPIMNRRYDFEVALPEIVRAANYSPPCEISILDYSSTDGLQEYLDWARDEFLLMPGNSWNIMRVEGKRYYHNTHAVNCSMRISHGDYVQRLSADAIPKRRAIHHIRRELEENDYVWMVEDPLIRAEYGLVKTGRFVICKMEEFIASGGYDERFELYGPEDKDFCLRLYRRGGKMGFFPYRLIRDIQTPRRDKTINYRVRGNFTQHSRKMRPILEENIQNQTLIANEGIEWGKWQ